MPWIVWIPVDGHVALEKPELSNVETCSAFRARRRGFFWSPTSSSREGWTSNQTHFRKECHPEKEHLLDWANTSQQSVDFLGWQVEIQALINNSCMKSYRQLKVLNFPILIICRTTRGLNVEEYEKSLRKIYTVFTVQRFWVVYYNIPKPGDLQPRSSLHMMRDDRKPVWEEEYNCKGGAYRIRVQKKDTVT